MVVSKEDRLDAYWVVGHEGIVVPNHVIGGTAVSAGVVFVLDECEGGGLVIMEDGPRELDDVRGPVLWRECWQQGRFSNATS